MLQELFADIALEVDDRARGESRLCKAYLYPHFGAYVFVHDEGKKLITCLLVGAILEINFMRAYELAVQTKLLLFKS